MGELLNTPGISAGYDVECYISCDEQQQQPY